uniref:Uncharacterized protein n=1 Tax=Xenopus tropicalis TaxID=8364 RepID=A0A6I8SMH8_XENTR
LCLWNGGLCVGLLAIAVGFLHYLHPDIPEAALGYLCSSIQSVTSRDPASSSPPIEEAFSAAWYRLIVAPSKHWVCTESIFPGP